MRMRTNIQSWKEFKHSFDNEPIYTRRQMSEALEQCAKEHIVNRVIQQGKDCDVAMQILSIHHTPEGIVVIVR